MATATSVLGRAETTYAENKNPAVDGASVGGKRGRVAKVVFDSNLARVVRPADYEVFIRSHIYRPEYRSLVS